MTRYTENLNKSLMETGIPIFRQVVVTIVVAENDTPIGFFGNFLDSFDNFNLLNVIK